MKFSVLVTVAFAFSLNLAGGVYTFADEPAFEVPAGYKLQYEQMLLDPAAATDFVFSDPAAWRINPAAEHGSLEHVQQSKYAPKHRSPLNISLIDARQFGDFVLEVDLCQTGKEYGHRDMCLFFGFEDPAHFYYVHIATKTDDHAHNIFVVNDSPRKKISTQTTAGYDWAKPDAWHRFRLERSAETGRIALYAGDEKEPMMVAEDDTFKTGWIGFGSFDDTGKIGRVRIWAPNVTEKKTDFFRPLEAKK